MKRIVLSGITILTAALTYCQDFDKVYFNSRWEITSMNFSSYYRTSGMNDSIPFYDGQVTDFYKNGGVQMTGFYKNGLRQGEFVYYDEKQNVILKSEYDKNIRTGIWYEYHKNGMIKKKVDYSNNTERLIEYYDENGISLLDKGPVNYSSTYYYDQYFDVVSGEPIDSSGIKYKLKGKITDGLKDGLWTLSTGYGTVCKILYEKGNFKKGEFLVTSGQKKIIATDIFTYLIIEPHKLFITESFFHEQGQMIKLNYVLKVLQDHKKKEEKKIKLSSESEIADYFERKFSLYVKNCSDTFRINLHLKTDERGKLSIDTVFPRISTAMRNEANRVIESIADMDNARNRKIIFTYKLQCLNELDVKR